MMGKGSSAKSAHHAHASDTQTLPKSRNSPDLVILDIKLGEKSGLDVLQTLRSRHAALPIILCTAYDSFRHDLKSIAADAYVVKSYDSSELMDTVGRLLK